MKKKYVAYYRVSSKKQGISGLGLDAQKNLVYTFLKGEKPIEEFTDIESGTIKGNDREGLKNALNFCREQNATLIIAKLDRLSRNVSFISKLMESEVEFIATDMPQANKFTIHIFSALAEQEAQFISERTQVALQEARKKGKKLGSPQNLTQDARKKGTLARIRKALENENNRRATAMIVSMKKDNLSYRKIAEGLNESGFVTSTGKKFSSSQVFTLYQRYITKIE